LRCCQDIHVISIFFADLDPVQLWIRFGLIEQNGNGGFVAVGSVPEPSKRRPKRVDTDAPPI
jgi:hypothetical protein